MEKPDLVKLEEMIVQEPFSADRIQAIAEDIREQAVICFGSKDYLTEIANEINDHFRLRLIYPIGTIKEGEKNVRESFLLNIPAIAYLFENKIPSRSKSQKMLLDESLLIDYFEGSELNKEIMDYLRSTDFRKKNMELITIENVNPEDKLTASMIMRVIPVSLQVDVLEYRGGHETRMLNSGYFQKDD